MFPEMNDFVLRIVDLDRLFLVVRIDRIKVHFEFFLIITQKMIYIEELQGSFGKKF